MFNACEQSSIFIWVSPHKKTPTMMYQMKKYHVMVKNKLHEFCHVIARSCCISIKIKTSGKTYGILHLILILFSVRLRGNIEHFWESK